MINKSLKGVLLIKKKISHIINLMIYFLITKDLNMILNYIKKYYLKILMIDYILRLCLKKIIIIQYGNWGNLSFLFNPEQKTIGFYNPLLKKIPNSEFDFDNIEKNNTSINNNDESNSVMKIILNYILYFLCIIAFVLIIIYIIKKLYMNRKKRANELKDDYDYLPNFS